MHYDGSPDGTSFICHTLMLNKMLVASP